MGAYEFQVRTRGKTAEDAFQHARDEAYGDFMSDHDVYDGYSGTIYEKSDIRIMSVPDGMTAQAYIDALRNEDDDEMIDAVGFNPFHDKFGPAGCIDHGDGSFTFFGTASS